MSDLKIKVCGLTQLEQIEELIKFNINFLGFIFYEESPRFVLNHLSLEEIANINHNGKVGVFVNENIEKIAEISEKAKLNYIQLHGDENSDYISKLRQKTNTKIQIIKAIRIKNNSQNLSEELKNIDNNISKILFDTDGKNYGGTGKTFDWELLNQHKITIPYLLSGGISMENINDLKNIDNQPFAIDINSKFEIEAGIKNLDKIKKSINLIKNP